jgi:hypothetical protein
MVGRESIVTPDLVLKIRISEIIEQMLGNHHDDRLTNRSVASSSTTAGSELDSNRC